MDPFEPAAEPRWDVPATLDPHFCPECGAPLDDQAVACPQCNTVLVDDVPDDEPLDPTTRSEAPRVLLAVIGAAVLLAILFSIVLWPTLAHVLGF